MAAAKRKLAVNVLVRDPKTDQPVFLQAGQDLPSGFKDLVAEVNLVPKQTAGSKKKTEAAAEEVAAVEEAVEPTPVEETAPEPEPVTADVVDDSELDAGDSFDTE
ncbi:hypothetical protein [Rothia nasimurium]|uniref:hypothetical protein n=1 Tax=Rothia nasimurium TaxID=85336 RepID=UPI001F2119CC|nr:hypothetical protein [Rothia nasimurium]